MSWINSRRLGYLAGVAAVLLTLFIVLRLIFLLGFSGLSWENTTHPVAVLNTLGMGVRFDLRLALLAIAPLALLAWMPKFNLVTSKVVRIVARSYLVIVVGVLLLVYIIDFAHYAYLGVRINATVLRYIEDVEISAKMVWQSYPVVLIVLAWLATTVALTIGILWIERKSLGRSPTPIPRWSIALGVVSVFSAIFIGLLGRVDSLNLENPVPLRWSDVFYSGDAQIAALGLNPVLFLRDTLRVDPVAFDQDEARHHYPLITEYLGIDQPDSESLSYRREFAPRPSAPAADMQVNIVFVMLESLGASAMGAYGNPLNPTPNLDRIASEGLFFRHFYVPVTGTAKTVWATVTGVPDVTREETASRNPLIARQNSLINALDGYEKYYMIGGNAGWANINALIKESIDNVHLYEERNWRSPLVDVWGISDLNLFKEGMEVLAGAPKERPFFAFLQTSGNHRPFTIPRENDGFKPLDLSLQEVQNAGSRSVAQYNAVRLLDFNIGKLMELADQQGFLNNTIFVFFGDHNTRISKIPHMAPAFEQLGLESNNVPLIFYAPGLIEPGVYNEAAGLVDIMPTVLGLLGRPYVNLGMGRDLLQRPPEGERVVPLVLREGTFPIIGGVTKRFLLQMQHDGSSPTLHDIYSPTPMDNVAEQHRGEFERLMALTKAMHETSRIMLYRNVRDRAERSP